MWSGLGSMFNDVNFVTMYTLTLLVLSLLKETSWWRHQVETFSALLAICAGNSPVSGEFPAQRPVTRSFDVFFDLRLNKRLSKQSWGWWFETLSIHTHEETWISWCHAVNTFPDSKVHGANMGPIWGRQDPGGPHVGPMNLLSGLVAVGRLHKAPGPLCIKDAVLLV